MCSRQVQDHPAADGARACSCRGRQSAPDLHKQNGCSASPAHLPALPASPTASAVNHNKSAREKRAAELQHVSPMCGDHPNEEVEYFDEVCHQYVCRTCVQHAHRGHQCSVLDAAVKAAFAEVADVHAQAKQHATLLEQMQQEMQEMLKKLTLTRDTTAEDVRRTVQECLAAMAHREQCLLGELDSKHKAKVLALQQHQERLTALGSTLSNATVRAEQGCQGSALQTLQVCSNLQNTLSHVEQQHAVLQRPVAPSPAGHRDEQRVLPSLQKTNTGCEQYSLAPEEAEWELPELVQMEPQSLQAKKPRK
eukprot:m.190118 g.190118  ORF g.190118 m.190118 type:complete len:308 (+) comp21689_c1_seq5:82-1005(+)